MGSCCGDVSKVAPDEGQKFTKESGKDLTRGPFKDRKCTDILCLLLFIAHWIAFAAVSCIGFTEGDPWNLVRPRDFQGNYCGSDTKEDFEKQLYMMNVEKTVNPMMDKLVCSSVVQDELLTLWGISDAKYTKYLCDCCISPCSSCTGSGSRQVFSSPTALASSIGTGMNDLTGLGTATSLWNGGLTGIVNEVKEYFWEVCVTACEDISVARTDEYKWQPAPDHPLKDAWDALDSSSNAALNTEVKKSFTFSVLPTSKCPYSPKYCIPMPGLEFTEIPGGYCLFKVNSDITAMAGSAYDTLGSEVENAAEDAGTAMGSIVDAIDAFIITSILGFVIGLVFLVLLRFFVGIVVWTAIFLVGFFFLVAGFASFIRAHQCKGDTFTESGTAVGVAGVALAENQANNLISGTESNEAMTGNGQDYRGVQKRTSQGHDCMAWTSQTPHRHSTSPMSDETLAEMKNYCRNPGGTAQSIWCFTEDEMTRWELCTPVGEIVQDCPNGYHVEDETLRDVLKYAAYVIWGFCVIWFICILCFEKRIRLAIALNKVAAEFVYTHAAIVLVPCVQAFVAILWCLLWAFCVAFIITQVPDDYVPTEAYASYEIAYGTADVAGKCTDMWPSGIVYHSEDCTGEGADIKCWRCAPPRFYFDPRYHWYLLLTFFWNNNFLIALGQCIIAGACGVWFFTVRGHKGKQPAVRTGLTNALWYHTGSLAFGSLILAIVQTIRYIIKYFQKQAQAQKNKVMALLLRCLGYCIWCFEQCIKFLNKNAYIQVALCGTNFCRSAKAAFTLIFRNFIRFGVVTTLGHIVRSIGFFFITGVTAALGYFILLGLHPEANPIMPVILFAVIGYLISKLFMNVYELSVDTMLQCVIVTEELGGDEEGENGFVPKGLQKFIEASTPGK
jgi:hypothetical protein